MKAIIAQFIPIILILIMLTYSKEFVQFSHSILGKVAAIALVLFYTHLDKYVGAVLCLFVIVYYQSDFVENMLNTDEIVDELVYGGESMENFEVDELMYPDESMENFEVNDLLEYVEEKMPDIEKTIGNIKKFTKLNESMSNYAEVYSTVTPSNIHSVKAMNEFRRENCNGNNLMHKGMKVKPDMTAHIFPNVEFKDGECNVCESTCKFSIIENRLKTEKELFRSEIQEGAEGRRRGWPKMYKKKNKCNASQACKLCRECKLKEARVKTKQQAK